ncbi:MAG: malonate decarboxylase acyl carrier protein [Acidaminococcales bacterium]|jgi:malonate decarboxylase delta subunit|nr:malonate decarboxylase acyl carrier protein [Acidaminococcales bacterium]
MALQVLEFNFKSAATQSIPKEWSHTGVTGSGDLEVLLEKKDLGGGVKAKVVTPVKGFDAVWEKMIQKFVTDTGVGNLSIEINDDNATPIVVYMRLRQALAEATAKEAE